MKFKVGQKVTIRSTISEWEEAERERKELLDKDFLVCTGTRELQKYVLPLTITTIENAKVHFKDVNGKTGSANKAWIILYKENLPEGYYRDSEGFLTNKDNWKPGALGIL